MGYYDISTLKLVGYENIDKAIEQIGKENCKVNIE